MVPIIPMDDGRAVAGCFAHQNNDGPIIVFATHELWKETIVSQKFLPPWGMHIFDDNRCVWIKLLKQRDQFTDLHDFLLCVCLNDLFPASAGQFLAQPKWGSHL